MNWIELEGLERPIYINLNNVNFIEPSRDEESEFTQTKVWFVNNNYITVKESYEGVKAGLYHAYIDIFNRMSVNHPIRIISKC